MSTTSIATRLGMGILATIIAACSSPGTRSTTESGPTAPSAVSPAQSVATASSGPDSATEASAAAVAIPAELTPDGSAALAFPPRNETFDFRNELERKYRDDLRRSASSSYVDIEGDVVWTQEYLRYRVTGCVHDDAQQKVLDQIDGRGLAPPCGADPAGPVEFPPRNEPFAFRLELERKYRDGLRRGPTSSFVDIEGAIVWTQEYLRYRANRCGHVAARDKVLAQIDGRGIAPTCATGLSGRWIGESSYFNAPFVLDIDQTGTRVLGRYSDQHDRGPFAGTIDRHVFQGRVDFGDTGILFDARWNLDDEVAGDMLIGGGVGRRTFIMRKQ